jgi:hypothetical protein
MFQRLLLKNNTRIINRVYTRNFSSNSHRYNEDDFNNNDYTKIVLLFGFLYYMRNRGGGNGGSTLRND